jgi:hypothetical protein
MGRGPACDIVKYKERQWQQPERRSAGLATSTSSVSIPLPFPNSWLVDLFSTLPGVSEVPIVVSRLVFYCEWLNGFAPMPCFELACYLPSPYIQLIKEAQCLCSAKL